MLCMTGSEETETFNRFQATECLTAIIVRLVSKKRFLLLVLKVKLLYNLVHTMVFNCFKERKRSTRVL